MPDKLLLADDSVTIQRVIELTFADEDMDVAVVGDGRQAIERIQADPPDIVLADIAMPERDGYEVAAFVKSNPRLADIPVVLMTGAFDPIDEARARSVGCDAVLVKPFEPQMVIDRVRELLAKRRAARESEQPAASPAGEAAPASVAEAAPVEGGSIEDYFDRLDAAFATLGKPPRQPPVGHADQAPESHFSVGSLSTVEAGVLDWNPDAAAEVTPASHPRLASAFAVLLAAEQGHPLPVVPGVAPTAGIPDETIEEIVRRVLARLGDDSMRRLVLETAERLVREEIDRIKRS